MDIRYRPCGWTAAGACRLLLSSLLLAGWSGHAQNVNSTVQLQLTVLSQSNCKFTTLPPAVLSFGVLDLSSTTAATAQIGAVFQCKGSAHTAVYAVTADNGQYFSGGSRRMQRTDGQKHLPYSLSLSPATGTVPRNVPVSVTITGTIGVADFQGASAGNYSDVVVVTVQP